jgi:hypothetical protein
VVEYYAIIALIFAGVSSGFAGVSFIFTYTRNRKSEQIKIASEIWENVSKADQELGNSVLVTQFPDDLLDRQRWVYQSLARCKGLVFHLEYFGYLVENYEITDPQLIRHYAPQVSDTLKSLVETLYPLIVTMAGKSQVPIEPLTPKAKAYLDKWDKWKKVPPAKPIWLKVLRL